MDQPTPSQFAILKQFIHFPFLNSRQVVKLMQKKETSYWDIERKMKAMVNEDVTDEDEEKNWLYRRQPKKIDSFGSFPYVYFPTGKTKKYFKKKHDISMYIPMTKAEVERKIKTPIEIEHTLMVNDVLINCMLLFDLYPERFLLDEFYHERKLRSMMSRAWFIADGAIRMMVMVNGVKKLTPWFLELQNTFDKTSWQRKVANYIEFFRSPDMQFYFRADFGMVLAVMERESDRQNHRAWTEQALAKYEAEHLAPLFKFGLVDEDLDPLQYFCSPRWYVAKQRNSVPVFIGQEDLFGSLTGR